ncbi:MAG TPA: hypothetical protein VIM61_13575 [Chthoniobacterales bacterium]
MCRRPIVALLSLILLVLPLGAKAEWVWSRQVLSGVGKISALAYGDGRFVAGTSTGYLLTSFDAENWTVARPATRQINAVTFGQHRFVALVSGTSRIGVTVLYSGNGFSWSYADRVANRKRFQGSYNLTEVAAIDDRFVALGSNSRAFAASAHGNRWQYPLDGDRSRGLASSVTGLTARRNYLLCSSLAGATIQSSKDGAEWETEFQTTARGPARGIAAQRPGRRVVCVGENGLCLTSANGGKTWRAHPFGSTDLLGVAWAGNLFLAFSDKGVFSTPSGPTWTRQLWVSRNADHLRAVVGGAGRYVAAGANGSKALIMVSTGVPAPPSP